MHTVGTDLSQARPVHPGRQWQAGGHPPTLSCMHIPCAEHCAGHFSASTYTVYIWFASTMAPSCESVRPGGGVEGKLGPVWRRVNSTLTRVMLSAVVCVTKSLVAAHPIVPNVPCACTSHRKYAC
eukprot:3433420-Pyramimonas_sp.AAC.2